MARRQVRSAVPVGHAAAATFPRDTNHFLNQGIEAVAVRLTMEARASDSAFVLEVRKALQRVFGRAPQHHSLLVYFE